MSGTGDAYMSTRWSGIQKRATFDLRAFFKCHLRWLPNHGFAARDMLACRGGEQVMWWALASAIAASATALTIAFVAYPWQKRKDLSNQVSQERRAVYRAFINAANRMHLQCMWGNQAGIEHTYSDLKALMAELFVTAPDPVVRTLFDLDTELTVMTKANVTGAGLPEGGDQFESFRLALDSTIVAMRVDSFRETALSGNDINLISSVALKRAKRSPEGSKFEASQ